MEAARLLASNWDNHLSHQLLNKQSKELEPWQLFQDLRMLVQARLAESLLGSAALSLDDAKYDIEYH